MIFANSPEYFAAQMAHDRRIRAERGYAEACPAGREAFTFAPDHDEEYFDDLHDNLRRERKAYLARHAHHARLTLCKNVRQKTCQVCRKVLQARHAKLNYLRRRTK